MFLHTLVAMPHRKQPKALGCTRFPSQGLHAKCSRLWGPKVCWIVEKATESGEVIVYDATPGDAMAMI